MKNFESNMKTFCADALNVLKKYDYGIRDRITNGRYTDFYSVDWKGIGIASTTEPVIKYIIYTSLLHKYRMWSELKDYYNDGKEHGKLLDFGLYFGRESNSSDTELYPNVAVEMKWTKLTNKGFFYANWLQSIKRDTAKLSRCNPEYIEAEKYFMQFMFINIISHRK